MSRGRVTIMAGGTGGHIFPGLAVADALKNQGVDVRWLGATGGMEFEKVPPHGIEIDAVRITGLRGKGLKRKLMLPFTLLRGILDARRAMRAHTPDCVVSFGGYVAGPGGLAARLGGVPLVVHEQNRVPGMTNRYLARFAKRVMQAFPDTFEPGFNAETCGNPVRSDVAALDVPELRWKDRSGAPRLLITGGSQGARKLNECLPEALSLLDKEQCPIVRHQTGKTDLDATRTRYETVGINANVSAFIEDMADAYAWADLVVCRSGALTVSELAAAGCGAILIPFPHAVDDHQTRNGEVLVEAGGAILIQETDLDAQVLADCLAPLLEDRQRSLAMARASRSVAADDAAGKVAQACLQWVPA